MKKIIMPILSLNLSLLLLFSPLPCRTESYVEMGQRIRLEKARLRKEEKNNNMNISKDKYSTQLNQIPFDQQLPFTIFIYAQNAGPFVVKNLESIFNQKYQNYHIIYVDDASTDQTIKNVNEYLATTNTSDKLELITFKEPQGELKLMHSILNNCKDDEIILLLNGHDWLSCDSVLTRLCTIYSNSDIWLTYGTATSNRKDCDIGLRNGPMPSNILLNRHFRKIFPFMPARSFYAWLFKQIKKEDLIDTKTGDFFEHAAACYTMWPLMEMAHDHFKAIKEITYVVNCNDPIAKLYEDYHLRIAFINQIGKDLPVYSSITNKPQGAIIKLQAFIPELHTYEEAQDAIDFFWIKS